MPVLLCTIRCKMQQYWRLGCYLLNDNCRSCRLHFHIWQLSWQTEQQSSVAVTSSSNTMMNYLAQYTMDLPSRAEQTPAEFWRQRDNGSVIPLVALDMISAPASQAFVESLFSVCDMLTTGRRNRMRKSLRMRSWLKVNYNEICDLQ